MATVNLQERAMIVRLSISQWTARRYDRKVSNKVEKDYGSHDSGRWNKILIAREAIQKVQAIGSEARMFIYKNSLPWGDNGDRVIMNSQYATVDSTLKELETKFNEAVEIFCGEYPDLKEEAKSRLTSMFSEDDYPPPHAIHAKFQYRVGYYPIPQASDFRVSLAKGETDEIKRRLNEDNQRLLEAANRSLWEQVFSAVSHIAERLGDTKNVFRDSLVENLEELCKTLKMLNIMNDPDLEKMVQRIETKLMGEDPDTLRVDRKIRKEVAQEAQAIIEEIEVMGKRKLNL